MTAEFYIGLSVTYHDPAIAIVNQQRDVVFAEATERHVQIKRALNCEPDSLHWIIGVIREYCGDKANFRIGLNWRQRRPFYEYFCAAANYFTPQGLLRQRFSNRSTFLEKYKVFHMLACQTRSMAQGGVNLARMLREFYPTSKIEFRYFDHHLTHAAAACYSSPFEEALCLVVDSFGEKGSLAIYRYHQGGLKLHHEVSGIESLGFFYMKLTELCGFDWLEGEEWKVMGLAAYGKMDTEIYGIFQNMICVDGLSLRQNLASVYSGLQQIEAMFDLEDKAQRANLAFTGQYYFSELMERLIDAVFDLGLSRNLVLSGGCALNSSFNGQILDRTEFDAVHVPSAPADDGTALGAAFLAHDEVRSTPVRSNPASLSPYLGSRVSKTSVARLVRFGRGLEVRQLPGTICTETAKLLADGKLVAWIQGRAEFGPRALGNRSILADPRDPGMKDKINALVKFREEFRPFAPAILHEHADQYFENYQESRYMERSLRFKNEAAGLVPAVVHVDQTGRLQTVKQAWNQPFYRLIQAFHAITGVPILLNTSLNIMGKPIVHSVEDAVGILLTTGLDALVIDNTLFSKPGTDS